MEWISSKTRLPEDKQQVLIFIKDNFYIARFDKGAGGFRLKNSNSFWIEKAEIMWTELRPPGQIR